MQLHELRNYRSRGQRKVARFAAFVVALGVAVFGAVTVMQHPDTVEAQRAFGTAPAAFPAAPTPATVPRDFDYFPDHYVNQATKPEEPIATF